MRTMAGLLLLLPLLGACSDARMLGGAVAEQRRVMNDMQARATMAAVCDISLGAYWRELNAVERTYAGLVCGDDGALREAFGRAAAGSGAGLPARLSASAGQGSS